MKTNPIRPESDKYGYTKVTPEIAADWLRYNTENRTLRKEFVNTLTKKILEGYWEPSVPDHIAFYEDGTLANGQHRLSAIINAGVPVKLKVDWDIPKSVAICIDTGKSRSFSDNVKIVTGEGYYTSKISKMISLAFENGRRLTHDNHLYIAQVYKNQILAVKSLFDGYNRWFTTSSIMAAVFVAYIRGVPYETLSEFVRILGTGRGYDENSETVLKFRDRIQSESMNSNSYKNSISDCKRAQNVLWNFVEHNKLSIIKYPENFRYPLIILNDSE